MHRKISDFHLEQYLLGEAPQWVVEAVEQDPDAKARVRELEEDNQAFFREYPPERMIASIQERAQAEEETEEEELPDWAKAGPRSEAAGAQGSSLADALRRLLEAFATRPALTVGAAATLAILLVLPFFLTQTPEAALGGGQDEYVRLKGMEPSLSIYRQSSSGEVREISPGERAAAGDTLQIAYIAAGAEHGMIFSVDGRGTVTLHFPASPFESDQLRTGGEVALPYSYVLDDSPRFERFYLVAASAALDVAGVLNRVEALIAGEGVAAVDPTSVARIAASESGLDPGELGVESVTVSK
jgi:hypothetical protein